MKTLINIYSTTKKARIFTALVLTGMLLFGSGLTLLKSVTAAPLNILPENLSSAIKENSNNQNLPESVSQAVIQDLSRRTNINPNKLKIIRYSQQTWNNGCLGLAKPGEFCTQALVEGWRVVLSDGNKQWIYHTNSNGRSLRLANANLTPKQPRVNLPDYVKDSVLKAAAERLNIPESKLIIMQSKQQTWNDGCLELGGDDEVCTEVLILGWRVIVGAPEQSLVYHSNYTGSVVRLNEEASEISQKPKINLPKNIVQQVLNTASLESKLPVDKLQIVEVTKQKWSDACLGIDEPKTGCASVTVPGWKVTVSDGKQHRVYRVGQVVSIKYDKDASEISDGKAISPVEIPTSELPPPLDKGMVFRQISSGGFAGLSYQTVLLNDGRLIRTPMGDNNDSSRTVKRIPSRELRQFQQLLRQQEKEFQNLNYPASTSAADYTVYTLTSNKGSVRYNDISQQNLPQNLRSVIQLWNEIGRSYN